MMTGNCVQDTERYGFRLESERVPYCRRIDCVSGKLISSFDPCFRNASLTLLSFGLGGGGWIGSGRRLLCRFHLWRLGECRSRNRNAIRLLL